MFRTIIFKIAQALWFVSFSPLLLIGLVSGKLTQFMIMCCASGLAWLAKIIVGVRCKVYGNPAPNTIIASKHMSLLEILVLIKKTRNSFFIIKRELMMIPIYGWAFWRLGYIGVDRGKGATSMRNLARRTIEKIKSGGQLIIFPEGTRAKPGTGTHIKRGLLFIAKQAKIPIQPVSTTSGLFWPKRGKMTPGTAEIRFEPVLPYDASLEEITDAIGRNSA